MAWCSCTGACLRGEGCVARPPHEVGPVPELGYGKAVIVERLTTEEIRKLVREELKKAMKRP